MGMRAAGGAGRTPGSRGWRPRGHGAATGWGGGAGSAKRGQRTDVWTWPQGVAR